MAKKSKDKAKVGGYRRPPPDKACVVCLELGKIKPAYRAPGEDTCNLHGPRGKEIRKKGTKATQEAFRRRREYIEKLWEDEQKIAEKFQIHESKATHIVHLAAMVAKLMAEGLWTAAEQAKYERILAGYLAPVDEESTRDVNIFVGMEKPDHPRPEPPPKEDEDE